eukprot:Gb_33951 [translate_table: standard]
MRSWFCSKYPINFTRFKCSIQASISISFLNSAVRVSNASFLARFTATTRPSSN